MTLIEVASIRKIDAMRRFGKLFRLSADSCEEIAAEFVEITSKLARGGEKFARYRLRPGPLLNAIVLYFLQMPEAKREVFARKVLAELELFLAETDEERTGASALVGGPLPKPAAIVPQAAGSITTDDVEEPPKRTRRRK